MKSEGNWNAGACMWGASNVTLRDSALFNNNRSLLIMVLVTQEMLRQVFRLMMLIVY